MTYPAPPPPPQMGWSPVVNSPYAGLPGLHPDGSTKGPSIWIGAVIVGIAIVMGIASVIGMTSRLRDFREVEPLSLPGSETAHLDEGEWRLMSLEEGPRLDADTVDVTGPASVRLRIVDSTDQFVENRSFDGRGFREVAAFDIDVSGDYTFESSADTARTDLIVVRATTSLISSAIYIGAWALFGLFGGLLLLIGLIPLIMSLVNRSRAKRSRAMLNGYQ